MYLLKQYYYSVLYVLLMDLYIHCRFMLFGIGLWLIKQYMCARAICQHKCYVHSVPYVERFLNKPQKW